MTENQNLREFSEWLDTYRDLPVHEVFHEIVLRYEEALATTEPAVNQQLTSMTQSQPVTLTDDKIEQLAVDSEIVFRRQGKLLTPFLEHIDLRRNVHAFANAIIAALREKELNK